jgi:hypothetical protein
VSSTGVQILFDETRATAIALERFDTTEDMRKRAEVFVAMDASETART